MRHGSESSSFSLTLSPSAKSHSFLVYLLSISKAVNFSNAGKTGWKELLQPGWEGVFPGMKSLVEPYLPAQGLEPP